MCHGSPHHGVQDIRSPSPPSPTICLKIVFPDKKVLEMVRAASEDDVYFSIEFNEFLKMISRKESDHLQLGSLLEAFKYIFVKLLRSAL